MSKIAVFGATGQTGRIICELLLDDMEFEVIACARTTQKLEQLKSNLGASDTRLKTRAVNIHRSDELDGIVDEADLVVGATSRWQDSVVLAEKAVSASTHYCGTYLSNPEKWQQLRAIDEKTRNHNVMIVDDCGTHPGLPAAMIRWVQLQTPLQAAWVGGKFDLEWNRLDLVSDTVLDFLSEIESTNPSQFADGKWQRGYSKTRRFTFTAATKQESCMPMLMEEIRELAESGSLVSTGFFIAGFGILVDYLIIPVSMLLARINRSASARLFGWGLQRFASRPRFAVLKLDAEVKDSGKNISMLISHEDPYFITAAPVVETIRQVLAEPKPGVWTQGSFVEPKALFKSLQQVGVHVETNI